jgi:2'-5' RNA ligase
MRLFVSIDLSDELVGALRSIQELFSDIPSIKLVDPTQAHLTLKFIGTTDPDQVPAIETALATSISSTGLEPFPMEIAGIGAFPSTDYIRVVWVGVTTGSEELTVLHESIESRLTELGVDPESHAFTPHITFARMEDARGKEHVQELMESTTPNIGTMEVTHVCLKESELTGAGPEYSTVRSFPLAQ